MAAPLKPVKGILKNKHPPEARAEVQPERVQCVERVEPDALTEDEQQ